MMDINIISPHASIYKDPLFAYNKARNNHSLGHGKFQTNDTIDSKKFRSINTKEMLDNLKRSMNVYQEPELSINDNGTGCYEGTTGTNQRSSVERQYQGT
jgi:hypothetical protein